MAGEFLKTQHTAYRQIRAVFGIEPIPNTDFRSIMPNKFNFASHWLECLETQRTAYCRIRSVFVTASLPNTGQYLRFHQSQTKTDDLADADSSELRSNLRSKLTGFEIDVGLTGNETKRLEFQLVVDQCSNWDWSFRWPSTK